MQRRDLLKLGVSFAIPTAWAQSVAKSDWRPSFLDQHQNETVIALTEAIIPATDTPGAAAASVNRYIDLFLRDGDAALRDAFVSGLNWLDGYSIEHHGHPFAKLSAAEQNALLALLESGTGQGHDFFQRAKAMTANIYYNTQAGRQELNKGERVPAQFGCTHSIHA